MAVIEEDLVIRIPLDLMSADYRPSRMDILQVISPPFPAHEPSGTSHNRDSDSIGYPDHCIDMAGNMSGHNDKSRRNACNGTDDCS